MNHRRHHNKCKPRMIPQQDKRICGCICLCQLVVVFSCVSLIYLTVAIYIPSYRAFNSGFEERPVMCQTVNTSVLNNCSWASCGEWCLTKASGFCPQIHAVTRQNGTRIHLQHCTAFATAHCPPVDPDSIKRYNCNNGTECAALRGVFNCTLGHCANVSQLYECHYRADGFTVDSDRDSAKLNGFFECRGTKCTKIKRAFSCDRICKEVITSASRNVFLTAGNNVHQASCERAVATTAANGNEEGLEIEPTEFWTPNPKQVFIVSCYEVHFDEATDTINAEDCINGTLYSVKDLQMPSITFKQFWNVTSSKKYTILDPTGRFVPMQAELTIFNQSRLFINLEGCVNTLRGECSEFLKTHGRDGKNQTAQSRFPCFYNKNDSYMVITRYNLNRTWRDLIIATTVPSILFVISFITLCVIMQSVRVDDDTKMRCKYCFVNDNSDLTEMIAAASERVSSPESDRTERGACSDG